MVHNAYEFLGEKRNTMFMNLGMKRRGAILFFDKAPSFEAKEARRYLNNRLGIFCVRGGGLLDHPYKGGAILMNLMPW